MSEYVRVADPLIHPQAKEMPDDYVKCPCCAVYVQVDADGLAVCQNCGMRAVFDAPDPDPVVLLVEKRQLALF